MALEMKATPAESALSEVVACAVVLDPLLWRRRNDPTLDGGGGDTGGDGVVVVSDTVSSLLSIESGVITTCVISKGYFLMKIFHQN